MFDRSGRIAAHRAAAFGLLMASLSACADPPPNNRAGADNAGAVVAGESEVPKQAAHLPLRIPTAAVMTGTINRSSSNVFRAVTSAEKLSEREWIDVGAAAVELVGAATLITIPGTDARDVAWVSDPRWLQLSADMQAAALAVGSAASAADREALTESTARLAQSCQSCHLAFSARLLTSLPKLE